MHRIARNAESCASCGEVTVYHVVKSCCGHQVYPKAQECRTDLQPGKMLMPKCETHKYMDSCRCHEGVVNRFAAYRDLPYLVFACITYFHSRC